MMLVCVSKTFLVFQEAGSPLLDISGLWGRKGPGGLEAPLALDVSGAPGGTDS